MPVGDLPGWHQIFADDFTTAAPTGSFPGAAYAGRWTAYGDGWKDTSGNGTYYPSKVLSVAGGVLTMHIHTENGVHLVAAPEPILPGIPAGKGQLYGRYTVRFRADAIPGYKTAWLLWPDNGVWPGDGEIDFPEANLTDTMYAYMHRMGATSGSDQDWYNTGATYTAWHTATIAWAPNLCTFILDGRIIGTSTSRVPSTAMHWVLQTETQLSGGAPSDAAAGDVQVDWVAVYAYAPGH